MSQLVPELSTWRIDMTQAGSMTIAQNVGYLHAWAFENGNSTVPFLDGFLFARMGGENNDEEIPLRYNSKLQFRQPVRNIGLRWVAQSNIFARILIGARAEDVEAENVPTTSLVLPALGVNIGHGAVSILTTATVIRGVVVTRRKLTIQALPTNPANIELGGNILTLGQGIILPPGAAYSFEGTLAQITGIAAVTGCAVRWIEEF